LQVGLWCDVFEIRDWKFHRGFIYLDPGYANKDTIYNSWLKANRPATAGITNIRGGDYDDDP
jgi:hypothetical protein